MNAHPLSFRTRQERRLARWFNQLVARHYLRKPDLAELLSIKFPDLGSLLRAGLNELHFRLRSNSTHRVLSLNVETTNFCNLACTICPVNRGMTRTKRFLDPARLRGLIDRTPGLKFLLPFQWGEPLLHPEIASMIRYASDRGIRTMLTTNGTLLEGTLVEDLLHSGLTRLTISIDGDDDTHESVRGVALSEIRERILELRRRRDAGNHSLCIDVSMVLDDVTRPGLQRFRREWATLVDRVQVIPRLQQSPRTSPCRELWRGSLVVLVDGTVTACCVDSEGALQLGNAFRDDPARILNDLAFRRLRAAHRCGEFPEICKNCGEYDGLEQGVSARFQ